MRDPRSLLGGQQLGLQLQRPREIRENVGVKLRHDIHLAYCTNIHRGEDWRQTFDSLQKYTMAVRARVSPEKPYAIGLRLSERRGSLALEF